MVSEGTRFREAWRSRTATVVLLGGVALCAACVIYVPVERASKVIGPSPASQLARAGAEWDVANGVERNAPVEYSGGPLSPGRYKMLTTLSREEFLDYLAGRTWLSRETPRWPPRYVWLWNRRPIERWGATQVIGGDRVRWPVVLGELAAILLVAGGLMTAALRRERRRFGGTAAPTPD